MYMYIQSRSNSNRFFPKEVKVFKVNPFKPF